MTRAIVRRSLLLAFLAWLPWPALAQTVPAAESRAIRAVVQAQLDAFAADDAGRAFSYAAPAIREKFGTPDRFLAMVRSGYPVVYRPATVAFVHPERIQGQWVQRVQLTDAGGALWLATYRLERQADGAWRISGCAVQPASGRIT